MDNSYEKQKNLKKERESNKKKRFYAIITIILILLIFSGINMASTSMYLTYKFGSGYFMHHIEFIFFSIICGFIALKIPYTIYNKNKLTGLLLLFSILTLLFVTILGRYGVHYFAFARKLVPTINGAIGWIRIGSFSIQPSEIIKIPFVIILAHLIDNSYKKDISQKNMFITLSIVMGIFFILLCWQKDLGSGLHYVAIFLFMLFMTKFDIKIIACISALALTIIGGAILYIYKSQFLISSSYKYGRIVSFLKGLLYNDYDSAIGYQVNQSLYALGRGGILGVGYANGVQKYSYLPEVTTDFIMSSLGEEFGFLGLIFVVLLFFTLFIVIRQIAIVTKNSFGKFLVIGLGGMIIIQFLINLYVVVGLLPVFGIPIPFFSYGGTSILTIMLSIGIILNVNNRGDKI